MVPRAAFAWVTRRHEGRGADPARHHQPHQRPGGGRGGARARRRRHGVDGAAVPRRRRVRQQGGRRAAPTRSTPASPATRPASTTSSSGEIASCLVNPRACHETRDRGQAGALRKKRIAVVGAGPAGLACATTAAERGHEVTLFEAAAEIGGQFNLARRIPGKEEFAETLRYFRPPARAHRRRRCKLGRRVDGGGPRAGFDHVVLATGIVPRTPDIPGIDHPKVAQLRRRRPGPPGGRARGSRSSAPAASASTSASSSRHRGGHDETASEYRAEWGIDPRVPRARRPRRAARRAAAARGLAAAAQDRARSATASPRPPAGSAARCSRSAACRCSPASSTSGSTTPACTSAWAAKPRVLDVDTIVICAGQEPRRELLAELAAAPARR